MIEQCLGLKVNLNPDTVTPGILNNCIEEVVKSLDNTLKVKTVNESDITKIEEVTGNQTLGEIGDKVKTMIREYLANLDKKEQKESADISKQLSLKSPNDLSPNGESPNIKSRTNAHKDFEEQVQT